MSNPEIPPRTTDWPLAVQVALSEFTALRAEIAQRSTSQGQLVVTAVTVTGLGLSAGAVTGWTAAALVVPVLCAVLGLMWADHAVQIEKIGAYIEHISTPHLRILTADHLSMMWEQVAKVDMKGSPRLLARLGVPVLAMGLVPSLPAFVIALPQVDSLGEWFLLALGLLLEASFVFTWRGVLRPLSNSKYRRALGEEMREAEPPKPPTSP